ncbi:N-acetylneuraminate synthase family protein [Saccharothrix sp.]|uniref:N-acetylneuraminate synthase family protein n=1 Tax=Saccharothrix sp. TaxID=1873460 RepID=UPI0028113569|nr:N-acetylneuraminate synthase family protein [Saccharothrix sp.]
MIDDALDAGVECVKFHPDARRRRRDDPDDVVPGNADEPISIYTMTQRCALSAEVERDVKDHAEERGLILLSTRFSRAAADRLAALDVPAYKIDSGECDNYPLVKHIAGLGKPVILRAAHHRLRLRLRRHDPPGGAGEVLTEGNTWVKRPGTGQIRVRTTRPSSAGVSCAICPRTGRSPGTTSRMPDRSREVPFVTDTRADFSKLRQVMLAVQDSERLTARIVSARDAPAAPSRLHRPGGRTRRVAQSAPDPQPGRRRADGAGAATTVQALTRLVHEERPDAIVVHGDRVEALAGALVDNPAQTTFEHAWGAPVHVRPNTACAGKRTCSSNDFQHHTRLLAEQVAAIEVRLGTLEADRRLPVGGAGDGDDSGEAAALLDAVRSEHSRVRARIAAVASYEERIHRLENALAHQPSQAEEPASSARLPGRTACPARE